MAVTYGTTTFEVEIASKMRPDWNEESGVVKQHIPYSNTDNIQFMGRGSKEITVRVYVTSDTHWATLKTYKGDGVARTLAGFLGGSFSSVYLKEISGERSDFAQQWEGTAVFLRQGT